MDAYIIGADGVNVYRLTGLPEVFEDILLDADGETVIDSKLSDPLTYGMSFEIRPYDVRIRPIERYWVGTEEVYHEWASEPAGSSEPESYARDITREELACVRMLDNVGFVDSVTYRGRTIERMSK